MRVRGVAAALAALLVMGCGSSTASPPVVEPTPGNVTSGVPAATAEPTPEPTPTPSGPPALAINVADGAKDVSVDTLITVTQNRVEVTDVEVTSTASGRNAVPVTGDVDANGNWVAKSRLDPGATYTVSASGHADDGTELTARSRFTTRSLSRNQEVFPTVGPLAELGGPFGVAQPVIIQFDLPVANKAEFERNLSVTSEPAQTGSWGWMSDTEVHYRPKDYWQPGTTIKLVANLNGVDAGNGTYGQLNRELEVRIGVRNVTKVDLETKQLTFQRDGGEVHTWPVSAGKPGFTTRSGTKIIMEKMYSTRMESETTGIAAGSSEGYDLNVHYALRLTQSGEFFHAAPWNASNFGRVNASHGCTGLSDSAAESYYEQAQIGDPVEFTGSDRELEWGNGWTEWNITWDQWQERSAL